VTGGTHGIGRATVSALSQAGWLVAFQGRSETEGHENQGKTTLANVFGCRHA
jgi:NAD(P)-dependent dehydrogenase (short-subunit alcohol dehydrogenase family)